VENESLTKFQALRLPVAGKNVEEARDLTSFDDNLMTKNSNVHSKEKLNNINRDSHSTLNRSKEGKLATLLTGNLENKNAPGKISAWARLMSAQSPISSPQQQQQQPRRPGRHPLNHSKSTGANQDPWDLDPQDTVIRRRRDRDRDRDREREESHEGGPRSPLKVGFGNIKYGLAIGFQDKIFGEKPPNR
jgi:hypothetical protein